MQKILLVYLNFFLGVGIIPCLFNLFSISQALLINVTQYSPTSVCTFLLFIATTYLKDLVPVMIILDGHLQEF